MLGLLGLLGGLPPDLSTPAAAAEASAYALLLERHVRPGKIGPVALHVVDYKAIAADPAYPRALADLAGTDPAVVGEGATDAATAMAFWINAYNLLAIKMVLDHYPVESIRDAGNFLWPVWKREAGTVAGRACTLDEIEHSILRPRFGDPRVHMAIVCASVSCPDLRREPYEGARLDEQLDDAARRFLSNPAKGLAVDDAAEKVALSSIFRWFSDDFSAGGGALAFVRAKASKPVAASIAGRRDAELSWLDYDWSLNDAARAR